MSAKKLNAQLETQVVALIARGDTYNNILVWLRENHDIEISDSTLKNIKERNKEALDYIKDELVKHETTAATNILHKSRDLIKSRLDRAQKVEEEIRELRRKRDNKEIDEPTYFREAEIILKNQLSITELNALQKESFHQSQIESGKPTAIQDNPVQAKANLERLLTAIANNDQEAAIKAIFKDA